MISGYQQLVLLSVLSFLMPIVDSASVPVPPPGTMPDQPLLNAWSDRSDEMLVGITSAPNPEDAAGSAVSSDQEFAMDLGGGAEVITLCCSNSGADSQMACSEGT